MVKILLLFTFSQFSDAMLNMGMLLASLLMLLVVYECLLWFYRTVILGLAAPLLGHRADFYAYRMGDEFYSESYLKIHWFIRLGRNKRWAINNAKAGFVKKRFFGGDDLNKPVEIYTRSFGRKDPVAYARFVHETEANTKKADLILKESFADGSSNYDLARPVGFVDSKGNIFKYYENRKAYELDQKLETPEKIGVCANFTFKGKRPFQTEGEKSDLEVVPYLEGADSAVNNSVFRDFWYAIRLNTPGNRKVRSIDLDTTNRKPKRRLTDLFLWKFIHAVPFAWPVKQAAYGCGFVKRNFKWFKPETHDIPLSYIGGAALLLLEVNGFVRYEDQTVKDPEIGMGETALLSLTAYLFAYKLLLKIPFLTKVFPFMGEQLSLILWMVLLFFGIWLLIHAIYNYLFWRPEKFGILLNMLNANVGTLSYSRLIIVFSVIGLVFTFMYLPHQLVPFFIAIIIAVSVNRNFSPQRKWEIADPFSDNIFDTGGTSSSGEEGDDNYNLVRRNYKWSYSAFQGPKADFKIELDFNPSDIDELRQLNPFGKPRTNSYSATVKDMLEKEWYHELAAKPKPFTPLIEQVLNKLITAVGDRKFTSIEQLNYILSFVQESIQYVSDTESPTLIAAGINNEYCRFSRETLFDQEGDCDCKSELAAALFARLGLKVAYMTTENHAFIGISTDHFPNIQQYIPEAFIKVKDSHFLCCETTAGGWIIGQVADSHRKAIEDSEIITFVKYY